MSGWNRTTAANVTKVMRIVVALVLSALVSTSCASSEGSADPPAAREAEPTSAEPTGPLARLTLASCVESYSPGAIAGRDFAFDGTIERIGDGTTDRPDSARLNYSGVTFAVTNWYIGGQGPSVTVAMPPPGGGARLHEEPPTYEVGTRLLVSGASRWGGSGLEDALAWGCGFTRYYDAQTAEAWSSATH